MKTIEAIKALFVKAADENAADQKTLEALEQRLKDLEAAADAALDSGDADKYMQIKDDKERTEARILITQRRLSKGNTSISREEAQEAWKAYVKTYAKDLQKAEEAYNKHRRELCEEYKRLVELQNAALKQREELGVYAGIGAETPEGKRIVNSLFGMPYIETDNGLRTVEHPHTLSYGGYMMMHPDPLFFHSVHEMTDADLDVMNDVLRNHFSHE